MNKKNEKTINEALELLVQISAWLAEKLLENLDEGESFVISDEWRQEITMRCEEIDKSQVKLKDAEEVFKAAYGILE